MVNRRALHHFEFITHGFSLIEVLTSMFILSLAVLGMDAMLLTALREAKSAYYFRAALQQIQNIAVLSTMTDDIAVQKTIWNLQNKDVLPHGRGIIEQTYSDTNLNIMWGNYPNAECQHHQITPMFGCLHYGSLQKQ